VTIDDGVKRQRFAVKCRFCEAIHHGIEITFPVANDFGYWIVGCKGCGQDFVVELKNPRESGGAMRSDVKLSREEGFEGDRSIVAVEMAKHNLEPNRHECRFNFSSEPLYECKKCGHNLDSSAYTALKIEFRGIVAAFVAAQNYLLKGWADHDVAVVRMDIPCSCGNKHQATFYAKMVMDPGHGLDDERKLVLADITGSNLSDTLTGIVSKSDFMDLLEKLIARWNLLSDQIIVVSPFVGYAQMGNAKKLDVWETVLSILDADRSVFLTRPTTWNDYKGAMESDGIPLDLLERFDLQNRVVAQRNSKHDFHAKFYAGVSADKCEILSGSANLVSGPSVENIAFHKMSKVHFNKRYIEKLNLKKPLPAPKPRTSSWVLIEKSATGWSSFCMTASSYTKAKRA
jgi:hypothetical protein